MTIQAHLDKLREQVSGCDLTAFGDLSSRLILRSSSSETCQRERLDDLCQRAVDCFASTNVVPSPDLVDSAVYGSSVLMFASGKSYAFARSAPTSDEFISAAAGPASDATSILQATRKTADSIGEAEE